MKDYFTLPELCVTGEPLDNVPDWDAVDNLRYLTTNLLNPIRELHNRVLTVNSGYRSQAVNKAIGGAETSQHRVGSACDFTAGSIEDNKILFELIKKSGFVWDQLIFERGGVWIHVSLVKNGNRNQVLTLG